MKHIRRKLLSQNFLHNPRLVAQLVETSGISSCDLVVEIGAGRGIITQELIKRASQVVALELDGYWARHLGKKFSQVSKLTLYHQDFFDFNLPKHSYKVFANIPFAIEGRIIRRLLNANNPPLDSHLIVMDKLAYRLTAVHKPNLFSTLHQPWFDFSIAHHFQPTDFRPIPNVNAVLFRFHQKLTPLLPWNQRDSYQAFVRAGYKNGRSVYSNLKPHFPHRTQAFHHLSINQKTTPSQLSVRQWIKLYHHTTTHSSKSQCLINH